MSVVFERHREFNGKIGIDTYSLLNLLYKLGINNEGGVSLRDLDLLKAINIVLLDTDKLPENRMELSIYYIRLCKIIDSLLKEYENYDDVFKKTVIDYYIQSNSIKEMNRIGLAWYYDVKYRKDTSTLYSVGYGEDSNWHEWLKNSYTEHNRLKEKGIQSVFHACKEHINRGGHIRLKSLSKCFGIDLFKYMQLDFNGTANLYLIKDAPINFIEYEGRQVSLQQYLQSDFDFDAKKKPEFCFDFSHPRNKKQNNFNNWSKKFLSDNKFISVAEVEDNKKAIGLGDSQILDDVILSWLQRNYTNGGDQAVSSRVSPIADKEVIASKTFWKIDEYDEETAIKPVPEKCYHITFDETEYCQLIYSYFKAYRKNKNQNRKSFEESYISRLATEKESIQQYINRLEEKQRFLNKDDAHHQDEDQKRKQKEFDKNSHLLDFFYSFIDFLDNVVINKTNAKIEFVLSFVDWNTEEIPEKWSLNNMYPVKEYEKINLKMNLYKCLCKLAASV